MTALTRLIRVFVAVGLTAIVLWTSHPSAVAAAAAGAKLSWIGAAVALVAIDRTLMAYRWLILLCALAPGTRPPFGAVLRIFFVSTFVGTFLPSLGGDVYRAYSLARLHVSGVESAASVLMDRVLGALSILVCGVAALAVAPHLPLSTGVYATLGVAAGACAVAAAIVFHDRAGSAALAIAARLPGARVRRVAAGLTDAVRRYARYHAQLGHVLALSIGVQVLRILQAWCLGLSLGMTASIGAYFVFIPIILLIMLLPITINGLGTSQLAFVWLFQQAAVPAPQAFALSILFVALGVVGNLPGGLLYATAPAGRPDTVPEGRR